MIVPAIILLFAASFAFLAWNRFSYAIAVLFLLLPTYLVRFNIGPLPSTLLETMILILFFVWIIKIKKNNAWKQLKELFFIRHRFLTLAIAIFLIGATIGVAVSINARAALGEWKAFYIEPVVLFLILITTLTKKTTDNHSTPSLSNSPVNLILSALILCGLAISALAIYQHYTGWLVPHAFWANRNTYRVTALYGFPNAVGLFLAPLIPFALYLLKNCWKNLREKNDAENPRSKNQKTKIEDCAIFALSALFIPVSMLAIFFAKSTGGLVGIAAGIGVLLLILSKTRWLVLTFGVVGLISLIFAPATNPMREELLLQDRSGQLRLNMWSETADFLTDRPFAGAGLASYSKLIYPYRIDKWIEVFHHPHNIFLTMWVNIGLLGLVGFLCLIVWFYRAGLKNISNVLAVANEHQESYGRYITPYVLSAMTVWITMGLVDSPYIKNDLALFFWLLPALLIVSIDKFNVLSDNK